MSIPKRYGRKRSFVRPEVVLCVLLWAYAAHADPQGQAAALAGTINAIQAPAAPVDLAIVHAAADKAAASEQTDRMVVLVTERNKIVQTLTQAQTSKDKAAIDRSQADLEAIDREIALVKKQPVYPIRTTSSRRDVRSVSDAKAPASESRSVQYESWDVFKNFGQRGMNENP